MATRQTLQEDYGFSETEIAILDRQGRLDDVLSSLTDFEATAAPEVVSTPLPPPLPDDEPDTAEARAQQIVTD